jgi:hypothetical protein
MDSFHALACKRLHQMAETVVKPRSARAGRVHWGFFTARTREELMKQFGGLRASYGTWKFAGNTLTRTRTHPHSQPSGEPVGTEGTKTAVEFRFEGDELVLKSQDTQREARFRKMK